MLWVKCPHLKTQDPRHCVQAACVAESFQRKASQNGSCTATKWPSEHHKSDPPTPLLQSMMWPVHHVTVRLTGPTYQPLVCRDITLCFNSPSLRVSHFIFPGMGTCGCIIYLKLAPIWVSIKARRLRLEESLRNRGEAIARINAGDFYKKLGA